MFTTYTDADHGGNPDNGRSTGGYAIIMAGGAVSWSSPLQPVVSLSTTEAEYIAAVEAGKEITSLKFIFRLIYIPRIPRKIFKMASHHC